MYHKNYDSVFLGERLVNTSSSKCGESDPYILLTMVVIKIVDSLRSFHSSQRDDYSQRRLPIDTRRRPPSSPTCYGHTFRNRFL